MKALFALLILGGPPALPMSPDGKLLEPAQWEALQAGKVLTEVRMIEGRPVKEATAVALVPVDAVSTFDVIKQYQEQPEYMPYVTRADLEKREGNEAWIDFDNDFPWPVSNRDYKLHFVETEEEMAGERLYVSRWTMVPGSGNLKDTFGSWEVVACGEDQSLVRFTVFTDPGGRLPKWARNVATSVAAPRVMKQLRARVIEKTR